MSTINAVSQKSLELTIEAMKGLGRKDSQSKEIIRYIKEHHPDYPKFKSSVALVELTKRG